MSVETACPNGCAYDTERGCWILIAHNCLYEHFGPRAKQTEVWEQTKPLPKLSADVLAQRAREANVPYCRNNPRLQCKDCEAGRKMVSFDGCIHRCRWTCE